MTAGRRGKGDSPRSHPLQIRKAFSIFAETRLNSRSPTKRLQSDKGDRTFIAFLRLRRAAINILNAMTTELDKSNIAYTYWMKGKEEGWEEGREEGREEGLEEGMEIGRDRANASTARALLGMGMKVEDIARATGLSEENILSLRL